MHKIYAFSYFLQKLKKLVVTTLQMCYN